MSLNFSQFELGVLRPTLAKLSVVIPSPEVAVRLVGETLFHESDHLRALGQYGKGGAVFGPGLGIGSMERSTWEWLQKDHLWPSFKRPVREAMILATGSAGLSHDEFAWNLALCVAGCRLRYFVDSRPLPTGDSIDARSNYWLKVYNGSGVDQRRLKYIADAGQIPWGTP